MSKQMQASVHMTSQDVNHIHRFALTTASELAMLMMLSPAPPLPLDLDQDQSMETRIKPHVGSLDV